MTLHAYTYQQYDSIYTYSSNLLLGYNNDEQLGSFQYNFMTEVRLTSYDPSFGGTPSIDSMVLYLDYTGTYGDTTPYVQQVTMYELNRDTSLTGINGEPNTDATIATFCDQTNPIATFLFTPNANDTMPIRVKLPIEFAQRFVTADALEHYDTLSVFLSKVFRGFYFVAGKPANGGEVCNFNYGDSTRMVLYYKNDTLSNQYVYEIDETSTRCNIFKRTYNPLIKYNLPGTEPDPTTEDTVFYVKCNNAFEGRIVIDNIQTWADSGNIAINKAILNVESADSNFSQSDKYAVNSGLSVIKIGDDGKYYGTDDYYIYTSASYTYQKYDTTTNSYPINVTRLLYKEIKAGNNQISLVLSPISNRTTPNRVILRGPTNASKLKLMITYTKLN